jgi:hypothetical protein
VTTGNPAGAFDPADAARTALEVLGSKRNAERQRIYDADLNAALDPLRGAPAIQMRCRKCRRRVGWCALHTGTALIAVTQRRALPKHRRGGMTDLYDPDPASQIRGKEAWIELAEADGGSVSISDWRNPSGYPLRVTLTCRCGGKYPTTNTFRLRQYLRTTALGGSTITL